MKAQIDSENKRTIFDRVRDIFIGVNIDQKIVTQTEDSTDERLVFSLSEKHVRKLAEMAEEIEENVPEVTLDVEIKNLAVALINFSEK